MINLHAKNNIFALLMQFINFESYMNILDKIFSVKKIGYKIHINFLGIKFSRTDWKMKCKDVTYKLYKYCTKDVTKKLLEEWYFEKTGNMLNLDNPITFNEKIQWLKLYDSTPAKTKLADKYLVKEWVNNKLGEDICIPLLGVWDRADDIDFEKLPDKFVLKCNHGAGYNIVVKNKKHLDIKKTVQKLNSWLKENYAYKYGFEMHYASIPRKIIAEKYICALN